MTTKAQLDQRIAVLTGLAVHEVAAVTSTFLRLIANDLVRGEMVELLSFGQFKMKEQADGELRISFHRSHLFKRLLQQHRGQSMDKLGVDESQTQSQEQLEKVAAEGCPKCGAKVAREGNILLCPNCGTEPFESKK